MTIGWKTLDVGEQALIYDIQGRARVEEGPKRIFLFRETFKRLARYSANQTEFIIITNKNGLKEHLPGPAVVYKNPLVHENVSISDGISLDANEVLVSYRIEEDCNVQRHIHYGPMLFMQEASEWLHLFEWHGKDPVSKTRKIPGQLKFTKLRVIPDQFYYNVEEVRTADDAVITVKLMIFYELKNIEQMLNSTQDPIADFINCLSADVVAYASKLTYLEFIERSGELNENARYPQLHERCKVIGYEVSKVVYRGYHADDKLQRMHNRAVAERAKLKINFEKEQQEQSLTDFQLEREMERIETEQKMEVEALEHIHKMEKAQMLHRLKLKTEEQEEIIQQYIEQKQSSLQGKKLENDQKIRHYGQLQQMSVDLTQYLLSLSERPEKIVRVIAPSNANNIHFHHDRL
ncbi:uncharacterized protein LOC135479619 [Liolophura sinensis]|uniref:uncharacterized protein LOC135479619 n=1 Tax=Liolophura sinensis TaxID=3198878 RepID=UPI00315970F2